MAVEKNANINLNAKDNTSKEIEMISNKIGKDLVNANERASESFKKIEQSTLCASKTISDTNIRINNLISSNENLNESLLKTQEDSISTMSDSVKMLDSVINILINSFKFMSSVMFSLLGRETVFAIIGMYASRLASSIDILINKLSSMGGVFSKIATIMSVGNIALKNADKIIKELDETGLSFGESIGNVVRNQLDFVDVISIASTGLKQYGNAMLATDGIFNKLIGTMAVVIGYTGEISSKIIKTTGDIGKEILLFGAAFVAIAGIDKLFNPIIKSIRILDDLIIVSQMRLSSLSYGFNANETLLKKLKIAFLDLSYTGIDVARKGLLSFAGILTRTKESLNIVTSTVFNSQKILFGLSKSLFEASKHTEFFHKGITGIIARSAAFGSVFGYLGTQLITSDSIIKKMTGVTLIAFAIALGGMATIVYQLTGAIGGLIQKIGIALINASIHQIEVFSEAEKTTFAFNQTIQSYSKSTKEASESVKFWTAYQEELTDKTGATASSVRALIAETIAATEATKLNSTEQKELIERSIDLSERAHKPSIEVLTSLIQAMNGSSQSVIALGLHVSDAAVEHSGLSQKQKELFKTTDDTTKAQIRHKVLMEQAGKAAGFASNNADLYSKSLQLQENALQTFNAELGRGSAIINGQYIFGLSTGLTALTNFSKPILPIIGFLSALSGRILEVTGFFIKNVLTITLAITSYKAFNVLLSKSFGSGVFETSIPLINKSINQIITSLGATNVKLDSLKNVGKASLQIISTQAKNVVIDLLGLQRSTQLTASVIGGQLMKGLQIATTAMWGMTKAAFAFAISPLGLTIIAIAAATYLLYKAFVKLEEETGIFSKIWSDLTGIFSTSQGEMSAIGSALQTIGVVLTKTLGIAIKFVAAQIATTTAIIYKLVLAYQVLSQFGPNAFKASSASINDTIFTIEKMDAAASRLNAGSLGDMLNLFSDTAIASEKSLNSFSIKIEEINTALAGLTEDTTKIFESVSEFTPRMNLEKFKEESLKAELIMMKFQGILEDKKIILINAPEQTEEIKTELQKVIVEIAKSEEVINGIRIKSQIETQKFRLSIVQQELDITKRLVFTEAEEEKAIRLISANDLRQKQIEIETNRILQIKGLLINEQREGTTIKQQAILNSNIIELDAFRKHLENKKMLQLTSAQQIEQEKKNIALTSLQGVGGDVGAKATSNLALEEENRKQKYFELLRNESLVSEKEYQGASRQILINGARLKVSEEIRIANERATDLGISQEGIAAKVEAQKLADNLEMQSFIEKANIQQMTDIQIKNSKELLELGHQSRIRKIKEEGLDRQIELYREDFDNSKEFQALKEKEEIRSNSFVASMSAAAQHSTMTATSNVMGQLSTLMQSKNKKIFEIGKVASISQALINTYVGASKALEAGPIAGPILAAATVAAGMVQVANIRAQKFGASAGGAGAGGKESAPTLQAHSILTTGGQADSGMTSIPKSLGGKSFVLSGGERVIKPEQNKDLTEYLKNNGNGQTTNINITINGSVDSKERVKDLANLIVNEIRAKSERGEAIINKKGVVNG